MSLNNQSQLIHEELVGIFASLRLSLTHIRDELFHPSGVQIVARSHFSTDSLSLRDMMQKMFCYLFQSLAVRGLVCCYLLLVLLFLSRRDYLLVESIPYRSIASRRDAPIMTNQCCLFHPSGI